MPQAALPDLNTQWIIAVREVWTAIKSENYNSLFGSLFIINSMLPKEYQVEMSDIKYNEAIKKDTLLICEQCSTNCKHCTSGSGDCIAETNRNAVKVKSLIPSMFVSLMTGEDMEKIWECPRCSTKNVLSKTRKIQTVLKEPYYLKIVPSPPSRKDGMMDRREYKKRVERWALQFLNELEHQMSKFRLEYVPKDNESTEEIVQDGQEHLDNF